MDDISVAQPLLNGNERRYVLDCLDTNWVSSNGKYIGLFESEFARYCGTQYGIATNNGTAALHLALMALGVEPGDEVIVPTVTFIATANAVRYCGARPVLVDVLPDTLTIDPDAIKEKITPRTKGIIPVHLYGHPADMDPVNAIARRHGLFVIEDAAEAHGAEYCGRRVGSLADCAIFSFFGNKILTTGEGGMIVTDNAALAQKMRTLGAHGMERQRRYWFSEMGNNYRMTNIAAAIGLAQLEQIDAFLAARQKLAADYTAMLAKLDDYLVVPSPAPWAKTVCWMYVAYLRRGGFAARDAVIRALAEEGIETRPVFYPLHTMPLDLDLANAYPVAEHWAASGINLPTHLGLTDHALKRIVDALAAALEGVRESSVVAANNV